MKPLHWISISMLVFGTFVLIGCQAQTEKQTNNADSGTTQGSKHKHGEHKHAEHKEEAKIKAALDELNSEDRKLAVAQKTCPVSDEPLGAMGKPLKITVKDQVIFLCCAGCEEKALADPEKTLAKVKEIKAQAP